MIKLKIKTYAMSTYGAMSLYGILSSVAYLVPHGDKNISIVML